MLSADGFWGCPVSFMERCEAPTRRLQGLRDGGSFLPKSHALFSVQLAKFSEDTLSSYTEAVSSQVPSPGWMLALYPQPELPKAPSGAPRCPCIMALSLPLRAPLAPRPMWVTCHCWGGTHFPQTVSSVGPQGHLQGNVAEHLVSAPRRCCAAFGATSCG